MKKETLSNSKTPILPYGRFT